MTISTFILAVSFLPFFEAKNTVANYLVNPPEGEPSVVCERPDMTVREPCPACDGQGEILMPEDNFGQANGRIGASQKKRVKCTLCKGQKRLASFMNPANLALQVARDREKFIADHQGRGEIKVGEAFVASEDFEGLTRDRRKLIEEAYGKPCTTCHWTGLEACKKCSGRGVIDCPNKDCKGGWAVVKTTTSYTRTKSGGSSLGRNYNRGCHSSSGGSRRISRQEEKVNVHLCEDCGGAKMVICPDCQGRRAKPCHRCNGLGTKQKGGGL